MEKARNVTRVIFSVKVAIWPLCIIVVWYITYSDSRSLVKNTRSPRISNGIASGTNDVTSDLRTRLNMQIFRNQVPLWPPVGVVLDYALVNGQLACFPQAGIPKDLLCLFQSFHWPLSPSGKGSGYLWAHITNFKKKLVKHRSSIRAVFKWLSKVLIRLWLLRLVIGFIIMRRFF